jgi:TonB family protein
MNHGTEAFFLERSRSRRRVASLCVAVGAVLFAAFGVTQIPQVRKALGPTPFHRFGFEGPPRTIELLRVEATRDDHPSLQNIGAVVPQARGGGRGGGRPAAAKKTRATEASGPQTQGIGDAPRDLLARALASQGRVPIFQSEDLIIEHLVRPEYPEDARARGVEGKVSVIALIDTTGQVVEAEVMMDSGEPGIDAAARAAVRQCRFRPYLEGGQRREVYAVFRFAFRLY